MKNRNKKIFEQYVDAAYNAGVNRKKYNKTWKKVKSFFKQYSSDDLE